jgi:hypothetical protein
MRPPGRCTELALMPTAFAFRGVQVGRLDRRIGSSERDDTLGDIRPEWWDARGSGLITQQPIIMSPLKTPLMAAD